MSAQLEPWLPKAARERVEFAEGLRIANSSAIALEEYERTCETVNDMNLSDIADLIDPTCHADPVEGDPYHRVRCSVCHTVWHEPTRVRYCPHCGCRRTFEMEGDE